MNEPEIPDEVPRGKTFQITARMVRRCMPGEVRGLVLGLLLLLVASGATLLQPWPVKIVIDSVIGKITPPALVQWFTALFQNSDSAGHSGIALLTLLCVGLLLIELIMGACHVFSSYVLNSVALRMVFKLRCALFDHVQRQSLAFHDAKAVGDSLYRITWDSYCIQAIFSEGLMPALTSGLTLLGIAVVMLKLDWHVTAAALAVAVPLIILVRRFDRPMTEQSLRVHEYESDVSTRVQETLVGIRAVQAFGREQFESDRFRSQASASLLASLRLTVLQTASQAIVGLVLAAGTAAVIWFSARGVLLGRLTAGDLVLLVAYVAMIFKPLETLAYTAAAVQNAAAGAHRVLTVLDSQPDVTDAPNAKNLSGRARGEIIFDSVSFGYQANQPVLRELSLTIAPGSTIALVGTSGAGKTTLASLIPRFYDPLKGGIKFDGCDLRDLTLKSLREQIALVTQDPILFCASIRENIAYGRPGATQEEIEAAARAAGAHEFIERLPEKYDARVAERGLTLSSGQRQRLAIARAFLKDAPVLILDEPTSALDAETEERLVQTLEKLMKGRTTIIIAHRLSTVRCADRIVVLQNGRIAESGPHAELLARDGLYARLHQLQFGEPPTATAEAAL
ncbi:MAG TPA: ABC transporter ATP-binding protein [Verrucomicrobia subdivision 3 bacterium]|nr:ABC transporter ATP-binding protein [Limisphaerales bacterium]